MRNGEIPRNRHGIADRAGARYDLGESYGLNLRLADLLNSDLRDGFEAMALGYGTPEGDPRLREAIAQAHGASPDDVVVTIGGMHALFLIAFALCDKGDEAVTTCPIFPQARTALESVGADVRSLVLSFAGGYRLDAAEMIRLLSERTRLVSLASPQNPSGVAIPAKVLRELLAAMGDICPDAYLLVDETYREAVYGDDPVAPSAVGLSKRVVSCGSLSKCHGAPGLRLGWAVTCDRALRDALVTAKFHTVISCSPVDEALALTVLRQRERIFGQRRAHLAAGLARTARWVEDNAGFIEWVRPDAGAMCCVRLKPSMFDDAAALRFHAALAQARLRVASGAWFGDQARVFRLGFGPLSAPSLDSALDGLTAAMTWAARLAA